MKRAALLQAAAQLDMLVGAFADAPPTVRENAERLRDSLKNWAEGKLDDAGRSS
jgi:hypothetical protein